MTDAIKDPGKDISQKEELKEDGKAIAFLGTKPELGKPDQKPVLSIKTPDLKLPEAEKFSQDDAKLPLEKDKGESKTVDKSEGKTADKGEDKEGTFPKLPSDDLSKQSADPFKPLPDGFGAGKVGGSGRPIDGSGAGSLGGSGNSLNSFGATPGLGELGASDKPPGGSSAASGGESMKAGILSMITTAASLPLALAGGGAAYAYTHSAAAAEGAKTMDDSKDISSQSFKKHQKVLTVSDELIGYGSTGALDSLTDSGKSSNLKDSGDLSKSKHSLGETFAPADGLMFEPSYGTLTDTIPPLGASSSLLIFPNSGESGGAIASTAENSIFS